MCAQNQEKSPAPVEHSEKTCNGMMVVVYPFGTMKYALASFANLLTLVIGITIGIMLAPHFERPAQAVSTESQAAPSATTAQAPPPSNIEQVSPTMTAGSIGSYLVLAHHVQSDELVVNGLDMMKLQQGELNLLSKIPGVYSWELSGIIKDARDTHLYQVASPKQPQPTNPPAK